MIHRSLAVRTALVCSYFPISRSSLCFVVTSALVVSYIFLHGRVCVAFVAKLTVQTLVPKVSKGREMEQNQKSTKKIFRDYGRSFVSYLFPVRNMSPSNRGTKDDSSDSLAFLFEMCSSSHWGWCCDLPLSIFAFLFWLQLQVNIFFLGSSRWFFGRPWGKLVVHFAKSKFD